MHIFQWFNTLFHIQESRKLPGTVNWGTATIVGVFAGLLYGGSKEASASVVSVFFGEKVWFILFVLFLIREPLTIPSLYCMLHWGPLF